MIASDYRGEIGVVLFNHSAVDFPIQVGDRIAQLILEKIKTPTVQKVVVLSAIDRGIGGFGSTGLQSSGTSSLVCTTPLTLIGITQLQVAILS